MKFARYLEDTQIPEWKKAYIDFRGLKKCITAIRRARGSRSKLPRRPRESTGMSSQGYGSTGHSPPSPEIPTFRSTPPPMELPPPATAQSSSMPKKQSTISRRSEPHLGMRRSQTSLPAEEGPALRSPQNLRLLPSMGSLRHRRSTLLPIRRIERFDSLGELLETLGPLEHQFFEKLDLEAAKIEAFFVAREMESRARLAQLKEQLQELKGHRKLFHSLYPNRRIAWMAMPRAVNELITRVQVDDATKPGSSDRSGTRAMHTQTNADPEDYAHAKRKLRRAVQEFYRGLELLNDYRVLNETGFRKALKKYDKYTRSAARDLYMQEKIEPCKFASKMTIEEMMNDTESLYADSFEAGNKKRATQRLRTLMDLRTHYASTFRAGIFIGLGLPALISGLYCSFLPETRERIPEWAPLLQVYGMLFIPTIFSVLVALNVLAWAKARINYVFIFELDLRTALDSRQYAQMPAFLFFLLAYALFFAFYGVGASSVEPTMWPLLWMAVVALFMVNPLPIVEKSARWWFLRNVGRLLSSGLKRVEFTDFWLGDQFCSMTYSLANVWFVACAAARGWPDSFNTCGVGRSVDWPVPFVLASLPSIVRFVQCLRRWADEGKSSHLVNAGKYASSVVMYLAYYFWRNKGMKHDKYFVVWCISATMNSLYTSYWDLFMDWSVLKPAIPVSVLDRERIYFHNGAFYFVASVVNVAIRFIWVLYAPTRGPSMPVRQFIAASLEALRRWQWNFFRLENEHVGNADQFRVTREVPLPYSFSHPQEDSDDESPDSARQRRKSSSVRLSGLGGSHAPRETPPPSRA